jgi:hypothetical protein
MQKTRAVQLGTRIRFVCTSHATQIPTVTMHEQQWAYCPGGYLAAQKGHFWTAISPARVSEPIPALLGLARRRDLGRGT